MYNALFTKKLQYAELCYLRDLHLRICLGLTRVARQINKPAHTRYGPVVFPSFVFECFVIFMQMTCADA